jgi:hypothetical protein
MFLHFGEKPLQRIAAEQLSPGVPARASTPITEAF